MQRSKLQLQQRDFAGSCHLKRNEQVWRDPARTKTFFMHSGESSYQAARSRQKNMLVCKLLSVNLNAVRSRPKDTTKTFISLIVDIVDPPQTRSRYLVMSPALEQAFSEIEKGAEERLEVLRSKKERVEVGEVSAETVPKLIGHMEKVEEEDRQRVAILLQRRKLVAD